MSSTFPVGINNRKFDFSSSVSQRVQLSFNGEKCVLILCAWKVAFLKSGHIYKLH